MMGLIGGLNPLPQELIGCKLWGLWLSLLLFEVVVESVMFSKRICSLIAPRFWCGIALVHAEEVSGNLKFLKNRAKKEKKSRLIRNRKDE